jgi:serine/threonine protein kinase/WD40 repeat protein
MADQTSPFPSPTTSATADANLLFGVLALQMDFVGRDQLIAGMQAWVNEKGLSLGDHLVRLGAMKPQRRRLLEPLVAEHIRQHKGEPAQSLAAVESVGAIQRELHQIDDLDLQRSVDKLSHAPHAEAAHSINATCLQDSLPSDSMRFRILRPHARGGLGEVFVAKDNELGREVALKEIQLDKSDDMEARTRFIREAEITGGLEHPGVVPVYSLGAYPDGRPFYAMRFIRGQTLHDAIKAFHAEGQDQGQGARDEGQGKCNVSSPTPLPPNPSPLAPNSPPLHCDKNLELRRLLQRFIDVCEAIDYAHSRGVLHRDLKPGNIMLGRYGETLVVDWGLAKAGGESTARPRQTTRSSSLERVEFAEPQLSPSASHESTPTQMGFVPGTPAYMSPEHALGRIDLMGPASDVFSLGATLYHLLTGRPPYVGQDVKEVQRQAQTCSYPRPSAITKVSRPLEAICLKALAVDPGQRYLDCGSLAADIERYLGDEPVTAYQEPLPAKVSRWMRRHSRLIAIAVICFLIVPVCLGSGLFVALQQKHLAQAAEDHAEVGQLCAAMALAHQALQAGDHPSAARALQKVPFDRRSWVYRYLLSQVAFQNVVEGASGDITCLAMEPDGDQLAYGPKSGEVCLRDSRTGAELRRASTAGGKDVTALAFSHSATQLASASGRAVEILNATTLAANLRVPLPSPVASLVFAPDDRQLIVALAGDEPRVVALHLADGRQQWSTPIRSARACLCFANQDVLVIGAGAKISTANSSDGTLHREWSLDAGEEVTSLLSIQAGGQVLACTSSGRALVYDLASGMLVRQLSNVHSSVIGAQPVRRGEVTEWADQHAPIVGSMPLAKTDVAVLVSSAGDVWIVNHQTGEISKQLTHKGVLSTAASCSGPRIAMADQDEVFVFDAAHALRPLSRQLRIFPDVATHAALSPDGQLALFALEDRNQPGQHTLVAHDLDADAVRWTIKSPAPRYLGFSPDGSFAVALCDDLRVLDSRTGACVMQSPKLMLGRTSQPGGEPAQASAVVDTAHRYVAVNGDTLQVWEIGTGRKVAERGGLSPRGLRLAPSSGELLGLVDSSVVAWRLPDLKEVRRLRGAATGDLMGITRDNNVVLRDGNRFVAQTWPGNELICGFEHDGPVQCIDFHGLCRRIVTGGADGKLNLWQYPTGEKLLDLPFSRTVTAVRFSLDGSRLVAIDREGRVEIWDSTP